MVFDATRPQRRAALRYIDFREAFRVYCEIHHMMHIMSFHTDCSVLVGDLGLEGSRAGLDDRQLIPLTPGERHERFEC